MVSSTLALLIFACMVGATTAIIPAIKLSEHAASHIITNTHNVTSASSTQMAALLAFKQAISNDPTNFLALWNTSVSPDYCDWRGVLCSNGTHDVIALLLDSNQLDGTLPPQLHHLSQLIYLNVSNNSFSGPIPSQLGELSSLSHLDLHVNHLTGTIPSSLSNCTHLQHLNLGSNALTGKLPSFVTSLNDLVFLDLADNFFEGAELPSDIGHLSNLQVLQLFGSGITGILPPSISNCTSLFWLDLSENNLTGLLPSDWSNLSGIREIYLMDNSFTGSVPATLGNCSTLISLSLGDNFLTGEVPESLAKLGTLQYLLLLVNSIRGTIPASLVNCTALISLQLGSNILTGPIPSGIGQLKQVVWMSFINNTKLSGSIPETIGDCTQLKKLSMRYTNVGGPLPTSLFNLSNLQMLWLSSSRFSSRLSEDVKNLSSLTSLALDRNTFVGSLPAGLGELTQLQELDLYGNYFEGSIPPALISQLHLLQHLYLQNNRLTGDIPDVFRSLAGLQKLDLSHNKLTGPVPQSLNLNESLDLSFNNLTGLIPPSLGNMHMVSTIKLAGNNLTGVIPDTLTGCQGLLVLDLSSNNLEGEIPSTLGMLVALQYLDLSQNNFNGALPPSLGDLLNLAFVNFSFNALQGRIPSTGIYESSSVASFAGNPDLCGYPLHKSCMPDSQHMHSRRRTTLMVSIICSIGGLLMISVCIWLWWGCFSSSKTDRITHDEFEEEWFGMQKPEFMRAWTAGELRAMTNGFHFESTIGSGGASVCYKGMVETERSNKPVAIKRAQNEREARRSILQELKILGQVRHRNLVKGLGYCKDEGVVALVMEFMENGNLEELLQAEYSLSWGQRLNIAADVAEALVYLHHECIQPVIHCDLKPKNILIGSDMVAKISDFGIALQLDLHHKYQTGGDWMKLSTSNFRGTFGYAAPECVGGSRISTKADVYSYGVLLIELVTGMKPTSPHLQEQGITLHTWARRALKSRHIEGFLDNTALQESIEEDSTILPQLEQLLDLGAKCTNQIAKERPTMKEVRGALVKFTTPKLGNPLWPSRHPMSL